MLLADRCYFFIIVSLYIVYLLIMEALAALRATKKKQARLIAEAEEKLRLKREEDEIKSGNKKKKGGYEAADLAKAPSEVFAIGRDNSAGVWWKAPPVIETMNVEERLREIKRQEKEEKIGNKYRLREEDYHRKINDGIIIIPPEEETMETLKEDKALMKYYKMLTLGYNKDAVIEKLLADKKLVDERITDDEERIRLEIIQRNRVRKVLGLLDLEEVPEIPEIVDSEPESDADDEHEISHDINWEVRRYRRDNVNSPWLFKGASFMGVLEKCQVIIEDLANDVQYCFSVRARDHRGWGLESPRSNIVMVEAPLPAGWFRFFNEKTQRFYYTNLKTKQTSYTRPELDQWFLDESIVLNFVEIEINHLKELFKEEIEHFKMVTLNQFMDCLREVGERLTKRTVQKLFRAYANDGEKLLTWEHFMLVMDHIKRKRMTAITDLASSDAALALSRQLAAALMSGTKMGKWQIKYNATAAREFYYNASTSESRWDMPDDIRFFLPPKLEEKMMKIFDFSHIDTFKQHFSMLDINSSGDLTDKELKLFMKALNLNISDSVFDQLIKTIDLNGNGTIEFDEFCWMMYTMSRKEKKGVFEQIDFAASSTEDGNNMMHGNHGYIDFEQVGKNLGDLQYNKDRDVPASSISKSGNTAKEGLNTNQDNDESKDQIDNSTTTEKGQLATNLTIDTTNDDKYEEQEKHEDSDSSSSSSDSEDSYNEFSPNASRKFRKPQKVKAKINKVAAIEDEWQSKEAKLKELALKEEQMAEEQRKRDEGFYFDDGFEHSSDGDNDDEEEQNSDILLLCCKCFMKQKPATLMKKNEKKKLEVKENNNDDHGKYCFCGCRTY